jgi:succinate dehydrogenase / fumarate reductase cytochrome b subunit
VIAIDFWKKGAKYQRQMLWIVLALWLVTFAGFAIRHLSLALGGH